MTVADQVHPWLRSSTLLHCAAEHLLCCIALQTHAAQTCMPVAHLQMQAATAVVHSSAHTSSTPVSSCPLLPQCQHCMQHAGSIAALSLLTIAWHVPPLLHHPLHGMFWGSRRDPEAAGSAPWSPHRCQRLEPLRQAQAGTFHPHMPQPMRLQQPSRGLVTKLTGDQALHEQVGFPVMIKATAGGGGRGMRLAKHKGEFLNLLRQAQQEADAAFGNNKVYLERYVQNPRHIEFQVRVPRRHGPAPCRSSCGGLPVGLARACLPGDA